MSSRFDTFTNASNNHDLTVNKKRIGFVYHPERSLIFPSSKQTKILKENNPQEKYPNCCTSLNTHELFAL